MSTNEEGIKLPATPWIPIGRGDDAQLADFCQIADISAEGYEQIKAVLDHESITSPIVQLLDVTDSERLQDAIADIPEMLQGQVTVSGSQSANRRQASVTRGFTFLDTPQKIVLARFEKRTVLDKPDEFGINVGRQYVVYVIFPETKPGFKGPRGQQMLVQGQPASYRPGFRLITVREPDNAREPLRVWFNQSPRNGDVSEFGQQLPKYIYAAARELGATDEELCVRDGSFMERTAHALSAGGQSQPLQASYASGGSRQGGLYD